jgi:ketosteroid isomerase-like protein
VKERVMGESDETVIRKLIEARNAAIHEGDAERALEAVAENVTSYDLRPPLVYRGAAARDRFALEQWFATWEGPIVVDLSDPTVMVDGDLAVAFGLGHMQGRKKAEGEVELWYRVTLCFERVRGAWKVVHEHLSVPFRMDGSGLAALDLRPDGPTA